MVLGSPLQFYFFSSLIHLCHMKRLRRKPWFCTNLLRVLESKVALYYYEACAYEGELFCRSYIRIWFAYSVEFVLCTVDVQ